MRPWGVALLSGWLSVAAWAAPAVPLADDGEAARAAAITRLRAAAPRAVCRDQAVASQTYGSACASRAFPAPPMLQAPTFRWTISPGWWGVWSPFLIGDKVLTGSCNNDDHKGLSALDMRSGKTLWRIAGICDEGSRRGSMGQAAFFGLDAQTVLFTLGRDDGKPSDHFVVDVQAGKIVQTLTPAKRGGSRLMDGVFMVITNAEREQTTYLNALNTKMDQVLWRHDQFRYKCDKLDPNCLPVFAPGAGDDGIQFYSATAKDQPEPPTRQLHAFEVRSGKLLWKRSDQPVAYTWNSRDHRSDDGAAMVADGKVIIKESRLVDRSTGDTEVLLRALAPRTGETVWTTEPLADWAQGRRVLKVGNRIAAGSALVVEIDRDGQRELQGYRLADGQALWRRPAHALARLTASSGGVFLVAEQARQGSDEALILQGLDGQTGTLLWTTRLPGHNLPFVGEWGVDDAHTTLLQGPSWRIGADGAIYGVSMTGAYKLQ